MKNALFQGGIAAETLDLLISGASNNEVRKDSGVSTTDPWADDFKDQLPRYDRSSTQTNINAPFREMPWRQNGSVPTFNLAPGSGAFHNGNLQLPQPQAGASLKVPNFQRKPSHGTPSSIPDDAGFDDADSFVDEGAHTNADAPGQYTSNERRTLYFNGFSERTTYKDLLSVIKGGKLLSINLRPERSATVTFLDGAEAFLAWAKRHDIYLHSKRVSAAHLMSIHHTDRFVDRSQVG